MVTYSQCKYLLVEAYGELIEGAGTLSEEISYLKQLKLLIDGSKNFQRIKEVKYIVEKARQKKGYT